MANGTPHVLIMDKTGANKAGIDAITPPVWRCFSCWRPPPAQCQTGQTPQQYRGTGSSIHQEDHQTHEGIQGISFFRGDIGEAQIAPHA